MDDTITCTNGSVSISFSKLELALEVKCTTAAVCRPDNKQNRCKLGKYEELHFRSGSPLVCRVMGIACSSYNLSGDTDRLTILLFLSPVSVARSCFLLSESRDS